MSLVSNPSATSGSGRLDRLGRGVLTVCLTSLGLSVVACQGGGPGVTAPLPTPDPETVQLTSDGLAMVRKTARSRLWVKPDHNLGRYDNILVTGIGFQYGQGQDPLDQDQEDELGEMLVTAISGITEGTPVGNATQPGPCTVALQLGLKDIYLHIGETQGSSISYVTSFGSATMVVEFRDSESDMTLLRYAANRGLGGGAGGGRSGANLPRLGRALGDMVTDMTTELGQIVPTTADRVETECSDGIYKMTGRG